MSTSTDAYRSTSLATASPRRTIVRLYEAAVGFLAVAEEALASGRTCEEELAKARMVVSGLVTSLDLRAGDLARRLLQLYLFVLDRIRATSEARSDRGLAEARAVLDVLRSAWEEMPAGEVCRGVAARRAGGLNVKG
jgi:flagellin-specific chaperone FliS